MDWRGRATEREVKLQFFFQLFGVPRNPYHGLALSSDRTRRKVATFRGPAQPFAWIGCGRATEREVKLQLLRFSQGSRQPYLAYEAIE